MSYLCNQTVINCAVKASYTIPIIYIYIKLLHVTIYIFMEIKDKILYNITNKSLNKNTNFCILIIRILINITLCELRSAI